MVVCPRLLTTGAVVITLRVMEAHHAERDDYGLLVSNSPHSRSAPGGVVAGLRAAHSELGSGSPPSFFVTVSIISRRWSAMCGGTSAESISRTVPRVTPRARLFK